MHKFLLQSEMGYGDIFADTWKAFTDHSVIPLRNYDKKKVFYQLFMKYVFKKSSIKVQKNMFKKWLLLLCIHSAIGLRCYVSHGLELAARRSPSSTE